jgi:predicted molibdopterin-dependent oxidoreductase YjgC
MRIIQHPILGRLEKVEEVQITVDGKIVRALEGEPITAALLAAGIRVFRKTEKRKEPRGLFCAIGYCTDCVMTVNGEINVRACITPIKDGMRIEIQAGSEVK